MNSAKRIEWVLRIAVAGEFIGHGILALQGKKQWVDWFGLFGISDAGIAAQILFIIGALDIVLAILVLARPMRAALLWMAIWGFWTAILRPIVGESFWDFVERSANWGAPLALLFMVGWPRALREWWK